jgi:hypothetical protein
MRKSRRSNSGFLVAFTAALWLATASSSPKLSAACGALEQCNPIGTIALVSAGAKKCRARGLSVRSAA